MRLAVWLENIGTHTHGFAMHEMTTRQENNFDAIRLLAASAVIFSHAHPLTGTVGVSILGNSVGGLGVKIFFVISGYLIYASWKADPSVHRYLIKRSLRIFPALVVLCLVTVLIIGPIFTSDHLSQYFSDHSIFRYFRNVLLYPVYHLPGMFEKNTYPGAVNGSLWSLPIEFAMYLLLPIIAGLDKYLTRSMEWLLPLTAVALCLISLWLVRISPPAHPPGFYGTPLLPALDVAPYFLLGALARHMRWERWLDPMLALFIVAGVAFVNPTNPVIDEIILYLLLPYSVLALACVPQRWLKYAGRWGDVSYGVYIYAFLVQQCLCQLSKNHLSPMQNAFATLPIVLVLGWLSWHLVEKHALAFKPSSLHPIENSHLVPE